MTQDTKLSDNRLHRRILGGWSLALCALAMATTSAQAQSNSVADKMAQYFVGEQDVATCLQCHGGQGFAFPAPSGHLRSLYVDGKALAESVHKDFTCQSCHLGVDRVPHDLKKMVPPTCESCHPTEGEQYNKSIHRPTSAVDTDHPNCLYCHGGNSHAIKPVSSYTKQSKTDICARCHNNPLIMRKMGVPTDAVDSFNRSFHGRALRFGVKNAPTCVDCHTSHAVQPMKVASSTVYPENVTKTCSKCHPGAVPNFAQSGVNHLSLKMREAPFLRRVETFFKILTWGILGLLVLTIVLDMRVGTAYRVRRLRESIVEEVLRIQRGQTANGEEEAREKVYLWFTPFQRLQHWIFAISFILLALTGLPLRFPDVDWLQTIYELLGGIGIARIIHRVCAVIITLAFFMHLGYLIWSWQRIGFSIRKIAMLPSRVDWEEMVETFKFYFGKLKDPPVLQRYSFRAKFGYFAVFWGMPVMFLSGLSLWFPVQAAKLLPEMGIATAFIAHADEALLAIGAIFIWHIYTTVLSPIYLPLGRKMIFGKVAEDHLKEEHGDVPLP